MYALSDTAASRINTAAAEVTKELAPWVRHIRYGIGQDWTGEWAVFFRVLLSDEASKGKRLREMAPRVVWQTTDKLDIPSLGLFPYFDFRSESEQEEMQDPAWD